MNYTFSDRMNGLQPSAIREILKFTADPTVVPFAAGNPAPEAFPVEEVQRITSEIMQETPIDALQYSISEGYLPLRNTLKADLAKRFSIGSENDEMIITAGAQQAVELATKTLLNPGDTVLVERPSFIGSLNTFRSYQANLVGIDVEEDGISIQKLEDALKQNHNVKFFYVIPNFQNPSGVTTSLAKRKAIYEICKKYGVYILEDNPYGELRFAGEDVPSIKSFDTEGIVLYCGSFSKVLSPGLRVGYLYAPKEIIAKVTVCMQASIVHTAILNQMICNRFMNEVDYAAHIKNLCQIYRKKSSLMIDLFHQCVSDRITFVKPEGGLFMWCTLPDGVDMMQFCTDAVHQKVAVVPGTAFLPSSSETTQSFRVNYSTPSDEQIVRGMEILGKLSKNL